MFFEGLYSFLYLTGFKSVAAKFKFEFLTVIFVKMEEVKTVVKFCNHRWIIVKESNYQSVGQKKQTISNQVQNMKQGINKKGKEVLNVVDLQHLINDAR